jgi:hypothetical protein
MYVAYNRKNLFCELYLVFLSVCDKGGEWRKMKLIVVIKR